MNNQVENMDSTLFEASLNISKMLDLKFGFHKQNRVLSLRDVPGMTNAAINVLKKNGVAGISVGVNNACYPPMVTREPFIWKSTTGEEIFALWHPRGYPNNPGSDNTNPGGISREDCSMVFTKNGSEVLCFSFKTDNSGPPSTQELLNTFEILRTEFPGASIKASTLENFITAITPYRKVLRVIDAEEIGDTWIQGIASDPNKMAKYRALSRAFTQCITSGQCDPVDLQNVTRFLVKPPEHTWGLPSVYDSIDYTNVALQEQLAKQNGNYMNCIAAWNEQRWFNDQAFQVANSDVKLQHLGELMTKELNELNRKFIINTTDFAPYPTYTSPVDCGALTVAFDNTGSISSLISKDSTVWADMNHKVGEFVYRTYNEKDDAVSSKQYGNPGFGKPNSTKSANPLSQIWDITVTQAYRHKKEKCVFGFVAVMKDGMSRFDYGAPQEIILIYNISESGQVQLDVELLNKTPTRLEESIFLQVTLPPALSRTAGCGWQLYKMDMKTPVDPLSVMRGGSNRQHAISVQGAAVFTCGTRRLSLSSKDVPVVCPFNTNMQPTPFPLQARLDVIDGMAFNIFNNAWNTNYIFWYPFEELSKDIKSRFKFDFSSSHSGNFKETDTNLYFIPSV